MIERILHEREERILSTLRFVEELADKLGTTSYVWGGMTLSIHSGHFCRSHHDIDLMIINLHQFVEQFKTSFEEHGWHVEVLLNNHMLIAKQGDLKLHINNVVIEDRRAVLKHNGDDEAIEFPRMWLRSTPLSFYEAFVHVVEPQLLYVLKTNPSFFGPNREQWDDEKRARRAARDTQDIHLLEKMMLEKNVDVKHLKRFVSTC